MQLEATSPQGHAYLLRIHLPRADPPPRGHPLLWLLDEPTTWAPMQQAIRERNCDDVVVVGIGWDHPGGVDPAWRERDFSAAGAEAFRSFLRDQLQPRILANLPVDADRQSLAGHSLSGLFVLHTLMLEPRLMQRYVASSPSIWWNQGAILDEARRLDWRRAAAARVLLSVGSDEQTVGPEKPPQHAGGGPAACLGSRHMVDNASAFAARLGSAGVDVRFSVIEGETHSSVIPAAMAAALAMAREP